MPVPQSTALRAGAESVLDTEQAPLPELLARPGHRFAYAVYPNDPGNWHVATVDGAPVWLPKLKRVSITPGVAGCRTLNKGEDPRLASKQAFEIVEARGGVVIDNRKHNYVFRTPCMDRHTRQRGHVYHDAFETPRQSKNARQTGTVKYNIDHNERNKWVMGLIEDGVIPAPPPDVLDAKRAMIVNRIYEQADRRGVQLPEDLDAIEDSSKLPRILSESMQAAKTAEVAAVPGDAPARQAPQARPAAQAVNELDGLLVEED